MKEETKQETRKKKQTLTFREGPFYDNRSEENNQEDTFCEKNALTIFRNVLNTHKKDLHFGALRYATSCNSCRSH